MARDADEELGWRNYRREKKGLSTTEENRAIEWLATRLRSDDWKLVFSWDSTHWTKLKKELEPIDARNHEAIDETLAGYQRKNGLLIDVQPPPREIENSSAQMVSIHQNVAIAEL